MSKDGSDKSTFTKVLVGHTDYQVTGDNVVFKGQDLLEMAAVSMPWGSILGCSCFELLNGSESAETMEVDKEAEGSGEVEVVEVGVQVLTSSFEDD
ncbi:hypothetical protein M0R45_035726 [Rubus argutus]|uniref:Uncharacterized protein n=1 Tax=Rubus argutus TaxID=59490 RepID=A0AAW1VYA0_RUBAR